MKRGRRKEERQAQKHEKVILPQEMQVVILSEKISELDWLNVVARDTCENIGLILMVNVDMKWPCIQSLYFHSLVIASRANKRKKMTDNSKLEELRVKSGCDLSVRRGVQ
ncbi:hypothetical protein JHK87_046000 [Glycine soja]|nr:hypothetical protein JHK87_046000 [Glycine soja]